MSEWENRRRGSWGYFVCLLLLTFPLILVLFDVFLTAMYLGVYALVPLSLYTVFAIVVVFGIGARYRCRGINPALRNIINATDGRYFERIGADETDYP